MAKYSRETLIKSIRTAVAKLNKMGVDIQKQVDLSNLEYVSYETLAETRKIVRRCYLKCVDIDYKNYQTDILQKLVDIASSYGFSYEEVAGESVEKLSKKSTKKLIEHIENFKEQLNEKIIFYLVKTGTPFFIKREFDKGGNVINKEIKICKI